MSKDMHDLFLDELHDLLSCEEQIIKALPKVIAAAEAKELKDAYTGHLKETKGQVKRLEKIFKLIKVKRQKKFCKATHGLILECEEAIKDFSKSPVRDAAIISKTQRLEHYEISAYGTVRTFAQELGFKEAAKLLQETLNEEGNADKKPTKIAEGGLFRAGINHKANLPEKKPATKTATKHAAKKKPASTASTKKPAAKAAKKVALKRPAATAAKKTAIKRPTAPAAKKTAIKRPAVRARKAASSLPTRTPVRKAPVKKVTRVPARAKSFSARR